MVQYLGGVTSKIAAAPSSAESQCFAASVATQEDMYPQDSVRELVFPHKDPRIIYDDNQGCIEISTNPAMRSRTKHIDVPFHFDRQAQ